MAQIRITPEEIREAAEYLRQKRDEILKDVQDISRKIEDAASEWEGAAQSAFVESYDEMRPILEEQFPEVIEGIASQLVAVADTMEETDEQIAQSLK